MDTDSFVRSWHERVANRDLDGITEMLADDITLRSPAFFKPYTAKQPIAFLLSQVVELIPDFHYVATYTGGDRGVVLQFAGTVHSDGRDYQVEGVDIVQLDGDGRVCDFTVMVRPLNGLQALATEMKKRFAGG